MKEVTTQNTNGVESLRERVIEKCLFNSGLLLTDLNITSKMKVRLRCKEGHEWETTPHSIISGTWCGICKRKEMFETIKNKQKKNVSGKLEPIVTGRGGEIISGEYINQKSKFRFRCEKGHEWETTPNQIIIGRWCDKCHREKRQLEIKEKYSEIKVDQLKIIVNEKNGKILGGEYVNNLSKFSIQCRNGHIWETTPHQIIIGHWCRKCVVISVSEKQRDSIETYKLLVEQRGGKLLSNKYFNQHTKLEIECKNGHRWFSRPQGLKKGNWCRECYGTSKRNIEEMIQIGKERGGECLSSEYVSDSKKIIWRCSENHMFETTPNNIKHGKWCPECSSGMGERVCRLYFETIFQKPFLRIRPDWLKNSTSSRNLELDGYNDELRIGFEHQGEQHYSSNSYYSKSDLFHTDELKRTLCLNNGVKLIEIPELFSITKLNDLKDFLQDQFEKLDIQIPDDYSKLLITESEVYSYTRNKERIVLEGRVIQKCKELDLTISDFLYSGIPKVEFLCSNGHKCQLSFLNFLNKFNECSKCKKVNEDRSLFEDRVLQKCNEYDFTPLNFSYDGTPTIEFLCLNHHKTKINCYHFLTTFKECKECGELLGYKKKIKNRVKGKVKIIDDDRSRTKLEVLENSVLNIIDNRQGVIVSGVIKYMISTLQIKCGNGHVFSSNVLNVVRGRWCKKCSELKRFNLKSIEDIVTKKGGVINETICVENDYKFRLLCRNKHPFELSREDIRNNRWCQKCKQDKKGIVNENRFNQLLEYLKGIEGKCLSDTCENCKMKLLFECKNGHQFYSRIHNVLHGYWCKKCHFERIHDNTKESRKTIVKSVVQELEGEILLEIKDYNDNDEVNLKCKRGHVWKSRVKYIIEHQWCKRCSVIDRWEKKKTTIDEINVFLKSRNGKCLSNEYNDSIKTKLIFKCERGHTWESIWSNVKRGSWCPICSRNRIK